MKRNKISDFGQATFTQFQRTIQEMQEQISKYFHFDSQLWKAIRDHIHDQGEDNVLIDWPANHLIVMHRGTGPAFSSPKVFLYAKDYETRPPKEQAVYSVSFSVDFIDAEDRHLDYPPEKSKRYNISVPLALEDNFTKEAFDNWIAEERKKKEAATVERLAKQLASLKKHPLWRKIQRRKI